jgi:hypothetical protein
MGSKLAIASVCAFLPASAQVAITISSLTGAGSIDTGGRMLGANFHASPMSKASHEGLPYA